MEAAFELMPYLFHSWTKLAREDSLITVSIWSTAYGTVFLRTLHFRQVIDGWLNLTSSESGWPCGSLSMADVWELPEAALAPLQQVEESLCQSEDIVDELAQWPIAQEILEIVSFHGTDVRTVCTSLPCCSGVSCHSIKCTTSTGTISEILWRNLKQQGQTLNSSSRDTTSLLRNSTGVSKSLGNISGPVFAPSWRDCLRLSECLVNVHGPTVYGHHKSVQ